MKILFSMILLSLLTFTVRAQSHTIRLVTPWAVGGSTDIVTRQLAEGLEKIMTVKIIVENRSGANGIIASDYVIRSTDKNIFLVDQTNLYLNYHLVKGGIGFNPYTDLIPVAHLAEQHTLLVVHSSLPVKDLGELISLARKQPGMLTYGHAGVGSPNYINMKILQQYGKISFNEIGYKTTLAAGIDLAGGQIDITNSNVVAILPHIKSGKVRVIAKLHENAVIKEIPGLESTNKYITELNGATNSAIFAPAGIDKNLLERMYQNVNLVVDSKEFQTKLESVGMVARRMSREELKTNIESNIRIWKIVLGKELVN